MALSHFFTPELESDTGHLTLSAEESRHAVKSRRLKQGAKVGLLNGNGLCGEGIICGFSSRKQVQIEVKQVEKKNAPPAISVAAAIAKGDRQKTMIDALTQLGVSEIIPLECEYSATKYKAAMGEKWQKIAIEGAKQSQNPWFPKIAAPASINAVLNTEKRVLYADKHGKAELGACAVSAPLLVCIGPEGGFSECEQQLFKQKSAIPMQLGQHILRIEIAAIVALCELKRLF